MLKSFICAICLLAAPALLPASTLWVEGSTSAAMVGAGCDWPCHGWDAVTTDGVLEYGSSAMPGYVKFVSWGGFSGAVGGGAFDLGAIQFQNAQYWGNGSKPKDDPSSHYYTTLSGVITISGGQLVRFSYDLGLDTEKNGEDVLTGLPAGVAALPFTLNGADYDLNLLGFYQGGERVTSLESDEWEFQSAVLRADITERATLPSKADQVATPEPGTWVLLTAGMALLAISSRRNRGRRQA